MKLIERYFYKIFNIFHNEFIEKLYNLPYVSFTVTLSQI